MLLRYEPILPHPHPPPPLHRATSHHTFHLFLILDLFYFRYFSLSMTFTYFSAIYPGGHMLLHHTNYTRVGKQILELAMKVKFQNQIN